MFFTIVYIFSSFVLGAVFNIISVSTLFIPCLPPVLTLGISLLLIPKIAFNLDFIVIELGFVLEAIYNYFFIS